MHRTTTINYLRSFTFKYLTTQFFVGDVVIFVEGYVKKIAKLIEKSY